MSEYKKEKEKSNKGIIIEGIFASVFAILAIISLVHPILLIGEIWDWDIRNQLLKVNDMAIENSQEEIKFRLTYDNKDDTEIRIERAINVYLNLFEGQNTYIVQKTQDQTVIEFSWKTYYEKSLLEKRKIQLEEFYDGN